LLTSPASGSENELKKMTLSLPYASYPAILVAMFCTVVVALG